MLIEQLALAHHNIGRLYVQAANAQSLELADLYNAAAARLLGELRRTVLALREYRTPVIPKHVTVVKQQNVAAGDQQIAYLDGKTAHPAAKPQEVDNALGGRQQPAISHEQQTEFIPQSETGGSRETEPAVTRAVDA